MLHSVTAKQQQQALTVKETPEVVALVDDAVAKYKFAEEVFEAAKWRIARDRECGQVLPDTKPERLVIYLPPNSLAKSPGLLVRYFYEDHQVVVDFVKFYDYSENEAVNPRAYTTK